MKDTALAKLTLALGILAISCPMAVSGDWAMWGGSLDRNMVSPETGLPAEFSVDRSEAIRTGQPSLHAPVWAARLGSQSYGNPVVADGLVLLGTNNAHPRDPRYPEDRGVLMAFREADGRFLWQLAVPKISRTDLFNGDRRQIGICSSPVVEGDRVYMVTNRGEVLCLDRYGMSNGNDGPFRDEQRFYAQPKSHTVEYGRKAPQVSFVPGVSQALQPTDADIIWRFDMVSGVHTWVQDAANGAPLVYGDLVFVSTSNGICDYRKKRTALYPKAPSVIALDKRTGRLVAVDNAGIAGRCWHGQWSSPSLGVVNGVPLVFYGGGDGWCYAFDARPTPAGPGRPGVLRLVWRYNGNPECLRFRDGSPIRYKTHGDGPSEIIATPVFYKNRVYVAVGQDPVHGRGKGCLSCIDATQTGDVTKAATVWSYTGIDRSLSTVAISNGRVYAADFSGKLHCLDADTGSVLWVHETNQPVWGSPLVADGKVYLGTTRGYLDVLADAPTEELLSHTRIGTGIHSTPVAANHALYIMTRNRLLVFGSPARNLHRNDRIAVSAKR